MSDQKTERFVMRVSDGFLRAIDEWRRHQPDIPGRSEAARRLIEFGLEASILAKVAGAKVADGNDIEWADAAEALYKLIVKAHDAGSIGDADMEEANKIFGTAYADGMLRHEERQKEPEAQPPAPGTGTGTRYLHRLSKPKD